MTRWSSSLLLPATRIASPWIRGWILGNSSRICFTRRFARSSGNPRWRPISCRTLLPPAGTMSPHWKILSDRLRRIAFDSIRSFSALARMSESATRTILSFSCVRSTCAPLKSYRCWTSRRTWSSAFRSSISSKSETTSNDTSPATSCSFPAREVLAGDCPELQAPDAPVLPHLGGEEPCLPDLVLVGNPVPAGMPGSEHRVARDPVALDRQVVVALGLRRLVQVCPQRVVPRQRRRERVEGHLGRLGEERGERVPVVGGPGRPPRLQ